MNKTKFKETEVGLIPEERSDFKLGDLVEKIIDNRGKTPPVVKEGYELLEVNSIKSGSRTPDYTEVEKFVDKETYDNWFRTGHIQNKDIIIPTVGTIGNVAISLQDRGSVAQNLIALRLNEKCNPEYIYYLLSSPEYKEKLINLDIGGVQPSIKVPHLLNLEILIPGLNEQKQIAEILSSLDDKIELNRQINANLEKMTSALFKRWFVDFEFPDEDGKPYKSSGGNMIDSELGPIPEGWKTGRFGDLVEITSGKRPSEKKENMTKEFNIPLLGASSVMGFVKECLYNEPLLITGRVGTHGIIQRVDYPCWPSDNTLVIKSKYIRFVNQIMSGFNFENLNRGSTQPLITQGDLKNIVVVLPNLLIIETFEKMSKPFLNLESGNKKQCVTLGQARDSLLPRLINGKIRVKI